MAKVRLLILSSFASGFGLCSVVFALFTLFSGFGIAAVFRFLLTMAFFGINLCFTAHYYSLLLKEMRRINRGKSGERRLSVNSY
ncbi:MAG: hypothetical protein HC920_00540 [Oscillatoriales cyanobacterium SM2_3_0]|nr:hypothetical protein [Oscillatoriales cyanobacterium SM2_3_0]